ncbi:hypothetical protein QNO21_10150 [Microbacterium sp. zg-Y818]|uniref:hypothetical protein n=1 Tax=unclassified Microbacterium TaxID=2609290 RepID=UPI00214C6F4E|nr:MULTISPECIES: hypothetical protein [unclassified Microbacterium]MCR2799487.1 hypothetical protein [Microbacterium sp. zg.Y818]WIM21484.1 hypothetical protein QNO21_10150 [Microbacterium sp. zg-Y818]
MNDCVICGIRPAAGKGEHVWPAWFLKDADASGPPSFGWSSNGEALLNRDHEPLHLPERQRLLVPACADCNANLNTRFEQPAKEVVRRLAPNTWTGAAKANEWAAVGMWFAKILLLATHPLALHQHPEINKHRIIGDWETEDFAWLIGGTPPPPGLSLWAFRADREKGAPAARVFLPKVVQLDDGSTTRFPMTMITLEGICLTLVSHPGWDIEHPLVAGGAAWELLHSAHKGDLADLPLLPFNAVTWRRPNTVVLADGLRLDGTLPPLGAITDSPVPGALIDVIRAASF